MGVKGWKNFPHWRTKVVLVSNHPYQGEQFLLTGLFFHQYLFRPFKYGPWTLADRKNYYDKYPLLQARLVPVDRLGGQRAVPESLLAAKHILRSGGNLIIFPEGGRTAKGHAFLFSQKGRRIRVPLKEGFASLVTEPETILLPVWFEYHRWYNMKLTIGEHAIFTRGTPREETVTRTENLLLELADQTN